MYPLKLKNDRKEQWVHEECFSNLEFQYIKTYIHYGIQEMPMHFHNFYEINIIVSGEGRHYIEDKFCNASPGCVFVIPPNIRHGYYARTTLEVYHILISNVFMEHYLKELRAIPGYSVLFEIEPYLRSTFHKDLFLVMNKKQFLEANKVMDMLLQLNNMETGGKEIMKNGLILYLIGFWAQLIRSRKQLDGPDRPVRETAYFLQIMRSMEYIRLHFQEKLTIEFLSAQSNMSRSTFLRHFQTLCGCSPQQYQLSCRMQRATELLQLTDMKLAAIAQECGFYDSSHFIRIFTAATGKAPCCYR